MRRLLASILLAALPTTAFAQAVPEELLEIKEGEIPQIEAGKAYLLFRIRRDNGSSSLEPLLLRVPSADEIVRFEQAKSAAFETALPDLTADHERELASRARRQARGRETSEPAPTAPTLASFDFVWGEVANLHDVDFADAFVKTNGENTYLIQVPPGEYVLYGMSHSMGLPQMLVCFCLGTVGFAAESGRITDLGYFIGDFVRNLSEVPELVEESGYGPSSDTGLYPLSSGTVRPVRADSSVPATLSTTDIVPARYHAVGRFFTPNAMGINRLVRVPGVLDYSGGRVIDVATATIVPDNL